MTEDDFWSRVSIPPPGSPFETCWLWRGPAGVRTRTGHIRISYKNKKIYCHRLAWTFAVGDPGDNPVRHYICDEPSCVAPGHLAAFAGGALANCRDRDARNRRTPGLPRGHARGQDGHWSAKLDTEAVHRVRTQVHAGVVTVAQLSNELGVSVSTVRNCLAGRTYADCLPSTIVAGPA